MSETDPGPLPTYNMELGVTIINGSPYMPSLSYCQETPGFTIYYPQYCYPVKSPALAAIILLSLLYLFASKPGKICTHNSIDSFLITSSSVTCSKFNYSSLILWLE